jgi:N-carbamoylputrescine amidase
MEGGMIKVAAIQMQMFEDKKANIQKAETMVREAAKNGANIILIPELFEGYYFCKDMDNHYFTWAQPLDANPLSKRAWGCDSGELFRA